MCCVKMNDEWRNLILGTTAPLCDVLNEIRLGNRIKKTDGYKSHINDICFFFIPRDTLNITCVTANCFAKICYNFFLFSEKKNKKSQKRVHVIYVPCSYI